MKVERGKDMDLCCMIYLQRNLSEFGEDKIIKLITDYPTRNTRRSTFQSR